MTNPDLDEQFFAIVGQSTKVETMLEAANMGLIQHEIYRKLLRDGSAKHQKDPDERDRRLGEVAIEARKRMAPILGSFGIAEADIDCAMGVAEAVYWDVRRGHVD